MTQSNLFCLPFAGGSAYAYNIFKPYLAEHITLMPIELAGHGRRMREPLQADIHLLATDVVTQMQRCGLHTPYVLYGHSMGGLLAYLVMEQLRAQQQPLPARLVVSGYPAPTYFDKQSKKSHLPKAEFIDMLRSLGGCPPEVLADAQLIDLFEPILRADFKAVENYIPSLLPITAFSIPVVVLYGHDDVETPQTSIQAWQAVSTLPLEMQAFTGGHFFIFEHLPALGTILSTL